MGSIISIIIIVLAIIFGSIQSRRKRVASTTDVPPPQGQMPQHAQTVSRQIDNWRRSRRKTANQVEINKKHLSSIPPTQLHGNRRHSRLRNNMTKTINPSENSICAMR